MKILFIFPRDAEYGPVSVREFPSGGTEKTVVFLGEAFQKLGHTVEWLTTLEQVQAGPQDFPDVVISQHGEFLELFPEAKKVFWSHHFTDQPVSQRSAPYARCFADRIVTLSRCHADDWRKTFKLDSVTIGHGVWFNELHTARNLTLEEHLTCPFAQIRYTDEHGTRNFLKDPYRLIYASTPFRGLERIPALFREIKAREPRATIAICSSMATYGEGHKDAEYQKLFDELAAIPGVECKGSLNQAQLFAEYSRASVFFYPSIWSETYCLALDEALGHGCYPITSGLGALGERGPGVHDLAGAAVDLMHNGPWAALEPTIRKPKDWLDIARQWEREVLS